MSTDGRAAVTAERPDVGQIEQQLAAMERSVAPRPPGWAWALIVVGLIMAVGLSVHGYRAYNALVAIDVKSNLPTGDPVTVLQQVSNAGTRAPANIDSNSRNAYSQALTQYVFDGAGVCLGIALAMTGLFIRLNR